MDKQIKQIDSAFLLIRKKKSSTNTMMMGSADWVCDDSSCVGGIHCLILPLFQRQISFTIFSASSCYACMHSFIFLTQNK